MSNVLATTNLVRRFGRTTVLNNLELAVAEGDIYALIGINGAGKTTSIRILMNVLQPTSGLAEVFGRDSRSLSSKDFTRIGYVSQDQDLPEGMTVAFLLRYLKPFYPDWDDALTAKLLREFEIPGNRKVAHLSHGMRIKAALIASLAYRPRLLVLDEPFTGLDPLVRDELIQGALAHAEGTTVLVSSHDLAEVESLATHIGYLDQGRLQFSEKLDTLTGRFREIEITADRELPLPSPGHQGWLHLKSSANRVCFIDSQFDHGRTMAAVRSVFGEQLQVAVKPMQLRAIFLALAKAARKTA